MYGTRYSENAQHERHLLLRRRRSPVVVVACAAVAVAMVVLWQTPHDRRHAFVPLHTTFFDVELPIASLHVSWSKPNSRNLSLTSPGDSSCAVHASVVVFVTFDALVDGPNSSVVLVAMLVDEDEDVVVDVVVDVVEVVALQAGETVSNSLPVHVVSILHCRSLQYLLCAWSLHITGSSHTYLGHTQPGRVEDAPGTADTTFKNTQTDG